MKDELLNLKGMTDKQKGWCELVLAGKNRTAAAREAYPNANPQTATKLAVKNGRSANCQRYIELSLMTKGLIDKGVKVLDEQLRATKLVPVSMNGMEEVPDNQARGRAAATLFKLVKDFSPPSKEITGMLEVDEDTRYFTEWYMQEHDGRKPTEKQLKEFREANETSSEVTALLYSSEKTPFSMNPKHAIDSD